MSLLLRSSLLLVLFISVAGCASGGSRLAAGELQIVDPAVEFVTNDRRPLQPGADMAEIKRAVQRGWRAWASGDAAGAQTGVAQALQAGSNPETVLYLLGNSAAVSGNFNAARAYYENALKINPANTKALYNLATVYLTKAEDHFNFYVASVSERDVDQALLRLLADLDAFSQGPDKAKPQETSPLDSLRELLER